MGPNIAWIDFLKPRLSSYLYLGDYTWLAEHVRSVPFKVLKSIVQNHRFAYV